MLDIFYVTGNTFGELIIEVVIQDDPMSLSVILYGAKLISDLGSRS